MSDSDNLYRCLQIQSAEAILDPDDASIYRRICRWYSNKFHTPLHTVTMLSPEYVLMHYYESTMESIPYNDLYDLVIDDFLPEMMINRADDEKADEKALEAEQALSIAMKAKKAPIKSNKVQSLSIDTKSDQSSQPDEINMVFDDKADEE